MKSLDGDLDKALGKIYCLSGEGAFRDNNLIGLVVTASQLGY